MLQNMESFTYNITPFHSSQFHIRLTFALICPVSNTTSDKQSIISVQCLFKTELPLNTRSIHKNPPDSLHVNRSRQKKHNNGRNELKSRFINQISLSLEKKKRKRSRRRFNKKRKEGNLLLLKRRLTHLVNTTAETNEKSEQRGGGGET